MQRFSIFSVSKTPQAARATVCSAGSLRHRLLTTTPQRQPQKFSATSSTRSMSASPSSASSIIPVIDLAPFLAGTPAGKQKVAKEIDRACIDIGFFTIVGHQVPEQLRASVIKETRRYFDRPEKEKRLIPMTEENHYGYSGFEEENLSVGYNKEGTAADLKESFSVGPYNPASGIPPQRWPQQPPEFRPVIEEYYRVMERLCDVMLRGFALALQLPENWFADKTDRHRGCARLLDYPAMKVDPKPGQIRAGEHTDYGSLTILLQDGISGLQAKSRDGVWHDVRNVPNSFIINIGDLMARWTNDRWVSTPHRVVCSSKERRTSVAFFHNINHDHLVTCISTCQSADRPAKYKPILAWDHLLSKHLASTRK